ncbi:VOC family protein [Planctomonas sp. JC2975]|uniref:VOC family protein n=1 Tax=Planctomonas sp. JC2975 TaxID=2729626 RepID=UPI001472FA83|nr:VOC family protein [Planctomonas sp. JC2975]NNC12404.1 VOC family protein [Planctomonas sp. JC2975]
MTISQSIAPANGQHTTNGMPHGSTSITPHIVVRNAAAALDFYRDVFGARVLDVTRFPGGDGVAHAILDFGTGMLTLSDPMESYGLVAPDEPERHDYSLALYVPNCDDVTDAAAAAGATVREPVATFVTGDRYSSLLDPFGVRWSVMTRVEDLSFEESADRVAQWASSQAAEAEGE